MTERLSIAHIGHRGDGVVEGPDGPIFVPYTLPGEIVEVATVARHPDRRHLLRVATASPDRIAPICPHFAVCGGCAVQHWDETHYRAWKRNLVVTALEQAGLDTRVDDLVDAHGDGRRRVVFHARFGPQDILKVGFSALRQHTIVAIDHCPILAPALAGALKAAWTIAESLQSARKRAENVPAAGKPLDIHATATDAGLDVDVRGSGPLAAQQLSALARVAEQHRLARLTRHGELVAQRAAPTIRMGRATVALPPGAFLQATTKGEHELARLVSENVGTARHVADLFAGVGPFALRLAQQARVTAVDADEDAIGALSRAARTPGLKPIGTQVRDLFRRPLLAAELAACDAAVFDPPRQGAEAQARALAASNVPVVVAVSCNPATLARDATFLVAGGYRLTRVTPVDQFRYSAHVELVACFAR